MFDVGQKVICVRRKPWECLVTGASYGPAFGAELTVARFWHEGQTFRIGASEWIDSTEAVIELVEWGRALYGAKWFRPKEPNIEALRSLLTKLPAKQPEEV